VIDGEMRQTRVDGEGGIVLDVLQIELVSRLQLLTCTDMSIVLQRTGQSMPVVIERRFE
jgi:hypothetical protein